MLAAAEGSSVGDEDTQRLGLSVSKQRAGLCFRKVEEQTEKVDLQLPESEADLSTQTADIFECYLNC